MIKILEFIRAKKPRGLPRGGSKGTPSKNIIEQSESVKKTIERREKNIYLQVN
jgi:hypothetical protein